MASITSTATGGCGRGGGIFVGAQKATSRQLNAIFGIGGAHNASAVGGGIASTITTPGYSLIDDDGASQFVDDDGTVTFTDDDGATA